MASNSVKLLKGFNHNNKQYKEGDEFEGTTAEIELLARQGYCKQPGTEESTSEPANQRTGATSHTTKR